MKKKNIYLEIRKLRKKLDKSVEKNGTEAEETKRISHEMDQLVNEYYESRKIRDYPEWSEFVDYYKDSYEALKKVTKEFNEFPTVHAWDKFAQENNYLSCTSIQYISKLDWHKLRTKIQAEINAKI